MKAKRIPAWMHEHPFTTLTSQQRRICALIAQACSNQDIAAALHLELCTVKTHVRHIFLRLDVQDRVELLALALHIVARDEAFVSGKPTKG